MVDVNRIKFSLSQVITICINLVGATVFILVMNNKIDTLIAKYDAFENKQEKINNEHAADIKAIEIDKAVLGSRITSLEQFYKKDN